MKVYSRKWCFWAFKVENNPKNDELNLRKTTDFQNLELISLKKANFANFICSPSRNHPIFIFYLQTSSKSASKF
jgi:hypothetical protein